MNDQIKKLRLVYLRFLGIAGAFILLYSIFTYAFVIRTELLRIREDILQIWMPMALPFVLLMVFFRPRLRLLNFERKGDDRLSVLVYFFAVAAITVPTLISQQYLETATGTLTNVSSIRNLVSVPKSKYYTIDSMFVDKTRGSAVVDFSTAGRHNEDMYFNLYLVCPILNTSTDTPNDVFPVWYGLEYKNHISNRLSAEEKDGLWKTFHEESVKDFENKNLLRFTYLDRITYSTELKHFYEAAKKTNAVGELDNFIVLVPKFEPFELRNGVKLPWVFGSFAIGAFLVYLSLAWAPFHEERYRRFRLGKPGKDEEMKQVLSFFVPNDLTFFTPLVIDLNLVIFLIMVFSGLGFISFKADAVLAWGANYRPLVVQGQWWRLLTSVFLHGGVMHVIMNCYGLLFAGMFLEPAIGKWRFLISYIITGILASLTSVGYHDATISVGASGAIFGIYGVFLALLTTNYFDKSFKSIFLVNAGIFVGYNLLMGIAGGIDNSAHIGGLVSGLVIGYVLFFTLRRKEHLFV